MRNLATFQRDFAYALMTDGQTEPQFRSQAFAVYRNTAARGVIEALRASYPTVDMLLGEEAFTQIALEFHRQQPPKGPVLSDYGREFAGFLRCQPWTCELPYIADVAWLDWLWLESFLAADAMAPTPHLSSISTITLHPAARFAWLATPAMTIWLAHRDPWSMTELEPDWVEEGALFTRSGPCVRAEPIDAAMHRLLTACTVPTSVADAVTAVAAEFPTADVPELLRRGVACDALTLT
jgi:hypothetical protein